MRIVHVGARYYKKRDIDDAIVRKLSANAYNRGWFDIRGHVWSIVYSGVKHHISGRVWHNPHHNSWII